MLSRFNQHDLDSETLTKTWNALMNHSVHDWGQTHSWVKSWTRFYRHTRKQELYILGDDAHETLWPFAVNKKYGLKCLEWIGQNGGMPTDYVFGLSKGAAQLNINAMLGGLFDSEGRWDVAALTIPPWQADTTSLVAALAVWRRERVFWQVNVCGGAVIISLPSRFDEWLAHLGKRTRSDVRRYLRKAQAADAHLKMYYGMSILEEIDHLFHLSAQTWGVFRHDQNRAFIRDVVRQSAHRSELFLAALEVESTTVAAVLGYISQHCCFLHPAGVLRKTIQGMSPGLTMYALLFKKLIAMGITVVDMSPGLEEYKFRLGGNWRPIHKVVFSRHRRRFYQYQLGEVIGKGRELARRGVHLGLRNKRRSEVI